MSSRKKFLHRTEILSYWLYCDFGALVHLFSLPSFPIHLPGPTRILRAREAGGKTSVILIFGGEKRKHFSHRFFFAVNVLCFRVAGKCFSIAKRNSIENPFVQCQKNPLNSRTMNISDRMLYGTNKEMMLYSVPAYSSWPEKSRVF